MGYVLIISLPMVIFFILLSFGCYALGRHKGQQEGRAMGADGAVMAQGTPPPAPNHHHQYPAIPYASPHHPNPTYLKQQNGINAV